MFVHCIPYSEYTIATLKDTVTAHMNCVVCNNDFQHLGPQQTKECAMIVCGLRAIHASE